MLRRTARRDRMVGLFVAGIVLFNPPVLNLFGGTLFGWPVLYLYLFLAWLALIAGMAFVAQSGQMPVDRTDPGDAQK